MATLGQEQDDSAHSKSDTEENKETVHGIENDLSIVNQENANQNSNVLITRTANPVFTTTMTTPSPPVEKETATSTPPLGRAGQASMMSIDTAHPMFLSSITSATPVTPLSAGLKIRTDIMNTAPISYLPRPTSSASEASDDYHHNGSKPIKIARTPSIKQVLAESGSLSRSYSGSTPGSMLSSPQLAALPDLTPLPSPIIGHGDGSPGSWNRRGSQRRERRVSKPRSIEFQNVSMPENAVQNGELHAQISNQKRRQYHGLQLTSDDANNGETHPTPRPTSHESKGHNRHRSQSDYHAPPLQVGVQRQITVSGSHEKRVSAQIASTELASDSHMRREPHLAHKRGIEPVKPPTPPSSRASRKEEEDGESDIDQSSMISDERAAARALRRSRHTYFDAYTVVDNKRRRWRALKPLGEGTFSKVILATSQLDDSPSTSPSRIGEAEDDQRKLVAVKICEHGPKGGASEERIRLQLKRELELMKNLHHPSLIDLKAFAEEETRMVLVLGYCAGGDLFDIASGHSDLLTPNLMKRIFAEMVLGIKFLHDRDIVHRDIKLESRPTPSLSSLSSLSISSLPHLSPC